MQRTTITRLVLLTLGLATAVAGLRADVVETVDGARLTGTIVLIDGGVIRLDTAYAGEIEIKQEQVASFSTEDAVNVRLASGTVMAGPVESSGAGKLRIRSEDGVLETDTGRIAASWRPQGEDPAAVRAAKARDAERMKWRYKAGLDLFGREGNTEEFNLGINFKAVYGNKDDKLTFHGLYEQREKNGEKTDDRLLGGAAFESFFSEILGWYARTELETDAIDEIDLRSTSGAGLSYRLLGEDDHRLVLRSGLGYRYTSYSDGSPNESDPTLDFGLAHLYRFQERYVVETDISYVPSIDDFSAYRIVQDTGVEIPVGDSEMFKIRLGLKNEYDSEAVTEEELDTTYYTRFILDWK